MAARNTPPAPTDRARPLRHSRCARCKPYPPLPLSLHRFPCPIATPMPLPSAKIATRRISYCRSKPTPRPVDPPSPHPRAFWPCALRQRPCEQDQRRRAALSHRNPAPAPPQPHRMLRCPCRDDHPAPNPAKPHPAVSPYSPLPHLISPFAPIFLPKPSGQPPRPDVSPAHSKARLSKRCPDSSVGRAAD